MKRNWASIIFLSLVVVLAAGGCDDTTAPDPTDDSGGINPPPPPPPPPPPSETEYKNVTISAGYVGNLCPQIWNREADRDFTGHGPDVGITAEMAKWSETEIRLRVWFRATETRSDYTATSGYWDFTTYRAPSGWVIDEILTVNRAGVGYVDTDHAYDNYSLADGFISYFSVRGDTDGNDVGACTTDDTFLARLNYREVTIRLRKV